MNEQAAQEVGIKDVILRSKQIVRFLYSKWLIILIAGIAGGLVGLLYAFHAKPKYIATLNFVLSSNTSSGGGFAGFASQFGLNLGDNNDNIFSGDNIITLMKSRRMVQKALFQKPASSNKSLINIFIEDNHLNKSWEKNENTKNAYPFPDSATNMSLTQDSLSRAIYFAIEKSFLDVSKPDKDLSIYAVTATSENPNFSYFLTKFLVNQTSAFYINTKTSTAKQNLMVLQHEADSLRTVLSGATVSAGTQTDLTFNLNPAYQVQRSGVQESQSSATALGQAYGQVLQNLELAKITLQKETPLYQIIDEPTLPLEQTKPGKLISLIIGGFLVSFFTCILLVTVRVYKIFS